MILNNLLKRNGMIHSLELQELIFEKPLNRLDLLNYKSQNPCSFRVQIYRNHSFEIVEHTIKPFLDYSDLGIEFEYSDYDDSLSFLRLNQDSDLLILWLDLKRYNRHKIQEFLKERLDYLGEVFNKNILFIPLGGKLDYESNHVTVYSLDKVEKELGEKMLDERMESFSGTRLSSEACLFISKDLGLNYLPSLLKPNLKAILVDLDNTLYRGVLGEDGVDGILLTSAHRRLQDKLKEFSLKGFFIGIASKNDERDVRQLFKQRSDFSLDFGDFSAVYANWDEKTESVKKFAKVLNIGVDSVVFIDDNMGEVVSVLEQYPEIRVILAKEDASVTEKVLCNFPGLMKLNVNHEDSIRKKDMKANKKREELKGSLSKEKYLKSLNTKLSFHLDPMESLKRVHELANKTNQFIFTYKRYSCLQVEDLIMDKDSKVVTVSLKDDLSDSGIIGVIILKKYLDHCLLEECFVSCRALGRGMDDVIVLGAIKVGLDSLGVQKLHVSFQKGERNLPAEKFVKKKIITFLEHPMVLCYKLPDNLIDIQILGS